MHRRVVLVVLGGLAVVGGGGMAGEHDREDGGAPRAKTHRYL